MPAATTSNPRTRSPQKPRSEQIVKTWVFDSVGDRKYAVQIKRARNGKPFVKLVEGVPQDNGTFRRFSVTVFSEDFERFLSTIDTMRQYIADQKIRTPPDHQWQRGTCRSQR